MATVYTGQATGSLDRLNITACTYSDIKKHTKENS